MSVRPVRRAQGAGIVMTERIGRSERGDGEAAQSKYDQKAEKQFHPDPGSFVRAGKRYKTGKRRGHGSAPAANGRPSRCYRATMPL